MGRIYYTYNPNAVEPPEEEWEFNIECPNCGLELHEGDLVYEIKNEIIACEHCIGDLAHYVEDL